MNCDKVYIDHLHLAVADLTKITEVTANTRHQQVDIVSVSLVLYLYQYNNNNWQVLLLSLQARAHNFGFTEPPSQPNYDKAKIIIKVSDNS